ncbi:MAG: polysaccharide deacetylase family protein [Lawsonibacter sp.]|nr:polysaccharide deacetylase family protein [Lawsonibacter sp.]
MKQFPKLAAVLAAVLSLTLLASCQGEPPHASASSNPGSSDSSGAASSGGGSGADSSAPPSGTLYVLMYHHFVKTGQEYNVWTLTDDRFREDLQWLSDHGYTTVLPSELAAGEPLPEKAVMLTFDDGYDSNYYLAYPLLKEYNAKAAIALITGHIENQDASFLTWDMCREMVQSGLVEFGSHTHTLHGSEYGGVKRGKDDTQPEYDLRVFPDVQRSIDLIETNVGTEVGFFAYPHGDTDPWFDGYLREHFNVSVTTHHGSHDLSHGLYDMNRCNISMEAPVSSVLPG